MQADTLLREGKIDEALAALQDEVRKNPADPKLRVFLFQLLCVQGAWDRAGNQLNVAAELDPANLLMAQVGREAIQCEALRDEIFAGTRTPLVLGEPAPWVAKLIQAVSHTAKGEHDAAAALRGEAFEDAPASSGTLNDTRFEWLADADSRLGPILEAVIDGRYYWVPFANIGTIDLDEPADLRDFVWMPAHLTMANGGEKVALIPSRYAGSAGHEDHAIALARKTIWEECPGDCYVGYGQRVFATDAEEYGLLDVRSVRFDHAAPPAEPAEPEPGDG